MRPVNGRQIPAITSLQVAEIFGKQHKHVLRDIEQILTQVPEIFGKLNFEPTEYELKNNFGFPVKHPMCIITKDGFTLLTMGYTGEKAMKFKVADIFGKRHDHVLRDIRTILPKLTDDFVAPNFGEYEESYHTGFGMKKRPAYLLSKDGFIMLTMGYTGEKAMQFKEAYINRFNEMEAELARLANRVPDDPTSLGGRPPCLGKSSSRKSPHNPNQANGQTPLALEIVSKISQHPETGMGRQADTRRITPEREKGIHILDSLFSFDMNNILILIK